MDKKLKDFIFIQSAIVLAINAVLNGVIAYFLNRSGSLAQLTLAQTLITLAVDIAITSPILGTLNAWSAAGALRKQHAERVLLPVSATAQWLARVYRRPILAGFVASLAVGIILWGLTAAGMALLSISHMTLWGYIWYKTAYTGILGGLFTAFTMACGMYRTDGAPSGKETI